MLERCNEGDLYSVMKLIAQGVDVNFKVNPDLKQSLLHQVTIDGKATTYILELLIQNGAQVFSMDSTGIFFPSPSLSPPLSPSIYFILVSNFIKVFFYHDLNLKREINNCS